MPIHPTTIVFGSMLLAAFVSASPRAKAADDPKRDPHVHNGEIHIQPDQSLRAQWTFYVAGKKEGTKEFAVTRKAP